MNLGRGVCATHQQRSATVLLSVSGSASRAAAQCTNRGERALDLAEGRVYERSARLPALALDGEGRIAAV